MISSRFNSYVSLQRVKFARKPSGSLFRSPLKVMCHFTNSSVVRFSLVNEDRSEAEKSRCYPGAEKSIRPGTGWRGGAIFDGATGINEGPYIVGPGGSIL